MIEPEKTINPWNSPQARMDIKPFTALIKEPDRARNPEAWQDWKDMMNDLDEWLKGPQVEIFYDLNDDRDYAIQYQTAEGVKVARVSDCIQINGIRWHLQPGKNVIPKPVYEFILQCPEQRRRLSCPEPGKAQNVLGDGVFFKSSRSA